MDTDGESQNREFDESEWLARAVEQAQALHDTVRDDRTLRQIVEVLLYELACRIARNAHPID